MPFLSQKTTKYYRFDASSFELDVHVESFLKSVNAVYLDFGNSAYVKSDMMPAIMLDLLMLSKEGDSSTDVHLTHLNTFPEVADGPLNLKVQELESKVKSLSQSLTALESEKQKVIQDKLKLVSEVERLAQSNETLTSQISEANRKIELLRCENLKIQPNYNNCNSKSILGSNHKVSANSEFSNLRVSFEKLQKELIDLRHNNIDNLASLKVLEDENQELTKEIELLRNANKLKKNLP
jgi:hypothetical protein